MPFEEQIRRSLSLVQPEPSGFGWHDPAIIVRWHSVASFVSPVARELGVGPLRFDMEQGIDEETGELCFQLSTVLYVRKTQCYGLRMTAVSPLQERIRNQLQAQFFEGIQVGERINEAEIAAILGVSRTPVRRALVQLQREGVVSYEANRGFRLLEAKRATSLQGQAAPLSLDETVMRDMALGTLDGVISERALLARYNATPGGLTSTLRRLMRDQLAEPSPGRGWIFADVGAAALDDGYHFRQIVEPAAILSDLYEVDRSVLEALDGEHVRAIDAIETMDNRRLFELDAKFHLMIAQGARSASLVAAIERQNNIRRVNEYLGFGRSERIRQSMAEHRGIMAALKAGEHQLAAALMRVHLQISREETFVHLEEDLESVRSGRVRIGGDGG